MSSVCLSETEAAEAILIHLAERAGVDRHTVQRALKISRRTYYRRRRLPADALARRDDGDPETFLTRTEAACR